MSREYNWQVSLQFYMICVNFSLNFECMLVETRCSVNYSCSVPCTVDSNNALCVYRLSLWIGFMYTVFSCTSRWSPFRLPSSEDFSWCSLSLSLFFTHTHTLSWYFLCLQHWRSLQYLCVYLCMYDLIQDSIALLARWYLFYIAKAQEN